MPLKFAFLALSVFLLSAIAWSIFGEKSTDKKEALDGLSFTYFEPHAGGCGWYRYNLSSKTETKFAQFHSDCSRVHAALDPQKKFAVAWIGLQQDGMMQWLVNLSSKSSRKLPRIPFGELQRYFFGKDGSLHAIAINQQLKVFDQNGVSIAEFEGKTYKHQRTEDGIFTLLHNFIWDKGRWTLKETKPTSCCIDGTNTMDKKLNSIDAYRQVSVSKASLKFQSIEQLKPAIDAPIIEESKILNTPPPHTPANGRGHWRILSNKLWEWSLMVWSKRGSPPLPTGNATFRTDHSSKPPEEWPYSPSDLISIQTYGNQLLVSEANTGMRPRIYDMNKGTLLYSSDDALGVWVWPTEKNSAINSPAKSAGN